MKKLYKKYSADDIKDIKLLEELRDSLLKITSKDFMRYQKLLYLLNSKEYAWNPKDTGDRVVIFTERIETMKYLAEEGCLSLDGVRKTTRYQEIEVEYYDFNWKKQRQKLSGWTAQICQHEIDHLSGKII